MSHNHNHCLHDLKYCDHCDTVYCTKCNREWGGHAHYYYSYPQPYRWIYYGTPYTITWGSSSIGNFTMTNSAGQIVNDAKIRTAFTASPDYTNMKSNKTDGFSSHMSCTHN